MIRKQICIDTELDRQLEEFAEREGVSQSEAVRRALSGFLGGAQEQHRLTAGHRFLERAAQLGTQLPPEYRRLTREEAHDRSQLRGLERADLPARRRQKG